MWIEKAFYCTISVFNSKIKKWAFASGSSIAKIESFVAQNHP